MRPFMVVAGMFAFAVAVAGLPAGILALMLSRGPIDAGFMSGQVAAMIEQRLGDGFKVTIRGLRLFRDAEGLLVEGEGVGVRDDTGRTVIEAPRALVALDGRALLGLAVEPREIEFVGLSVALVIMPDGSVAISTGESGGAGQAVRHARSPDAAPLRPAPFVDAFAAPKGALAVLERAGLRDGSLLIDDRRNGHRAAYSDLSLMYSRPADETRLAVRARGAQGRWGASLVVRGTPGGVRTIEASVQDLAVAELLGFAEAGHVGIRTDMPVSFELKARLDERDVLTALEGEITGGYAQVLLPHAGIAPIAVNRMNGRFALAEGGGRIDLSALEVSAGGVQFEAAGALDFPRDASDAWHLTLAGRDASLSRVDPRAAPFRLDRIDLSARFFQGFSGLVVDSATAHGADFDIRASAAVGTGPDFDGLRFRLETGRMPADAVFALWPAFSAPATRLWAIENIDGGYVETMSLGLALSPADMAKAVGPDPLPPGSFDLRTSLGDVLMRAAPGLPRLEKLRAEVRVTDQAITVTDAQAVTAGGLALTEGMFRIEDLTAEPTQAAVAFRLRGEAGAAAEVLRSDALREIAGPRIPDPDKVRGTVEAFLTIDMPLRKETAAADLRVATRGVVAGLVADEAIGKERLEASTLSFTLDGTGFSAKGEGRIGGIPARFDYARSRGDSEPSYSVLLTVDDAVRSKRGMKTAGQISGPVTARVIGGNGAARQGVFVELDLTRAVVTGIVPTWTKPAGRPSKATVRVKPAAEDRFELIDFVLDGGGGVVVKGDGEIASDGTLNTARLSQVRLSPGDDMKVDLDRVQNGMRLSVRAQAIDARPFLRSVFGASGSGVGPFSGDLELDLKALSMQGFAGESLAGADLRLTTRSGEVRDFRLSGRLGRAPVAGQMARSEAGSPAIVVESADAGGFLRFVDLYRRMSGGALLLQVSPQADPLNGLIVVQNFTLRNDPALAGVARSPAGPSGRSLVDDAANVSFSKLRASFTRGRDGVLTVSDGVMWGTVIGGTLEGKVDFARDRVDLTGTFVPAFGLNNIPNKVPLFGALLFGGPNEGLFAVNFRITGSPAAPVVTYNPLSAVAPGFLRKFFGAGGVADPPVPPARVPENRPAPSAR
jgi:hypothetical protein